MQLTMLLTNEVVTHPITFVQ